MKIPAIILVLLFAFGNLSIAQENLDKMPQIKGGISQLASNIKYPEAAKKEGKMGTVFVKAVVDENGDIESAEVEKGVSEELNAAAVEAVKTTKFLPGVKNGENVKAEVTIPIKFKLDDKKNKN
jgi:TonB family protein